MIACFQHLPRHFNFFFHEIEILTANKYGNSKNRWNFEVYITKLGHLSCLEMLKSQLLNFQAQLLKFYYVKVLLFVVGDLVTKTCFQVNVARTYNVVLFFLSGLLSLGDSTPTTCRTFQLWRSFYVRITLITTSKQRELHGDPVPEDHLKYVHVHLFAYQLQIVFDKLQFFPTTPFQSVLVSRALTAN